MLSIEKH